MPNFGFTAFQEVRSTLDLVTCALVYGSLTVTLVVVYLGGVI
jgi:hypothetical protein